ncbi:hypothetical protein [Paenibacillus radicis (ex Gao et al. 2016)]|uniref:Uncharacterized protein n=1 Tax=Paenibacillus radicis (ex Gao et al. 2016) TaxID=1737354 RepID=A0A917LWG0_9BACL|nr:hypothetical protein [Paenibacillus radicis (ex Gao et al. 2016)]GGG61640.1 hypothetical protein GCM10010918_13990 [Paenibacillus radicis (ex Gao et al. 2016)]
MAQSFWKKSFTYLSAKLAASGGLFLLFVLVTSGLDLYRWAEAASFLFFWILFYGYAFCFSITGDAVLLITRGSEGWFVLLKVMLHIIGGVLPFMVLGGGFTAGENESWPFILFFGFLGAICAVIYDAIFFFMRSKFPYTAIVAVTLLLLFIILSKADMTVTRDWKETQMDGSYEASFDYFRGKKAIKVELEQDQSLRFSVDWSPENSGGYGHHVLDKHDKLVPQYDTNEHGGTIRAEQAAPYRIVVTGDKLKGAVSVHWSVE